MALDRFIYWKGRAPKRAEIRDVLEDFLRGLATSITWGGNRFTVILPGTVSQAGRRATWPTPALRAAMEETLAENRVRVFEVYIELLARFFDGT